MTEFDLGSRLPANPALLALWREQHLVDAVLRADGQTSDAGLRAHRIVLSAASAYLRALFCSEHWRQQQADGERLQIVQLPALASDAVRTVVETIYSGKLEVRALPLTALRQGPPARHQAGYCCTVAAKQISPSERCHGTSVQVSEETVQPVLNAANFLGVPPIVDACCQVQS